MQSRKTGKGILQRRFWEYQICDAADLQQHVDYIHYIPVKHGPAKVVHEWWYSSFHVYMSHGWLPKDWGYELDANVPERGERL